MEDEHNQDHELGGTKKPKTMKKMNMIKTMNQEEPRAKNQMRMNSIKITT